MTKNNITSYSVASESGGEGRLHTQTALRLRSLIYPPSR